MSEERKQHEVGYKKPPKSTRFQPGQSGNPRGRPKRIKDFDKLLDRELSQTIRITDQGEVRTLSKREVLVKTLTNLALKGDRHSIKLLVSLMQSQQSLDAYEPSPADRKAFLQFLQSTSESTLAGDTADE